MTIRNPQFLFRPTSVALLGAREQSASDAALLHNLYGGGFTGEIFLVSREVRTLHCSRLPRA